MDRDYDRWDRPRRPRDPEYGDADRYGSDRYAETPMSRGGWGSSPVVGRIERDDRDDVDDRDDRERYRNRTRGRDDRGWYARERDDREYRRGREYNRDDDDDSSGYRRGGPGWGAVSRGRWEDRPEEDRWRVEHRGWTGAGNDRWFDDQDEERRFERRDYRRSDDDFDGRERYYRGRGGHMIRRAGGEEPRWAYSGSESDRNRSSEWRGTERYSRGYDRDARFYSGADRDRSRFYNDPGDWERGVTSMPGPGPHTGRGPKGYRRSDDRIREDIGEEMTHHGHLDARDIEIDVSNGEVTLRGMVDSRRDKREAEDIAYEVSGVRDVHNQLRIRPEGPTEWGSRYRPAPAGASSATTATTTGMTGTARNVMVEMRVWGRGGDEIGTVKDVRANDFLVDRAMQRDVYVPFSAVESVSDDGVRLNVLAGDVDGLDWEYPDMFGSDDSEADTTATT